MFERNIYTLWSTEVVTVNITSLNEQDVEVSLFENGKEKTYTVTGTNRMGLFLSF